ncbi:MAG: histidinol-phosphate transaminase [Lysobacteraceae bacterium]|nr:MAG: histidinol-phosphate transaminase [Xanthomonadaceae bacterium]
MPGVPENFFVSLAQTGIQRLRAYDPGHDLVGLRRRFADGSLIELGSNENPYGPSARAKEAVLGAIHDSFRYPDPLGSDLKRALAAHHDVSQQAVLLGNGSHELLMQFAQVFAGPGADVVASRHGFAVYAIAAQAAGAHLRVAPCLPDESAMPRGHDLDALATAVLDTSRAAVARLAYLANPNNPTGTWYAAEAFEAFMAKLPREVIVVVDEAYAEFVDALDWTSALGLVERHPNLVVTRTFSKAYALAGLRVGYAIGHPELIAVMERVRESFNVNSAGLAAAEAALGDVDHLRWCVARNAEQRTMLTAALRRRGLQPFPSQTNFVLTRFADPGEEARVAAIETALCARGIVLRPMGGYGLGHCLRITVGHADEHRRLLAGLDEVLA